jgi:hypothetical protein
MITSLRVLAVRICGDSKSQAMKVDRDRSDFDLESLRDGNPILMIALGTVLRAKVRKSRLASAHRSPRRREEREPDG